MAVRADTLTPSPGIEPGPHWWKASALVAAPSLLPFYPHFAWHVIVWVDFHLLFAEQTFFSSLRWLSSFFFSSLVTSFSSWLLKLKVAKIVTLIVCSVLWRTHLVIQSREWKHALYPVQCSLTC